MQLHDKVRKVRELKGVTQEWLSAQIGLTQSAFSKRESGQIKFKYSHIEDIAKALDCQVEHIISYDDKVVINMFHNKNANGLIINPVSQNEKQLYEDLVKSLKDEILYLKGTMNKLLKTINNKK